MTDDQRVPELGPLEFELLRIVWKTGAATAREVLERYNDKAEKPIAYTTVMTLLTRMADKGVLRVDGRRRPFEFAAAIPREQLLRKRVEDFVEVFFDGRAVELALRLVEDAPLSAESIERLEDILRKARDEAESDKEEK